MEIVYFGGGAVKIKNGSDSILFDPVVPGGKIGTKMDLNDVRAVFCSDRAILEDFEKSGLKTPHSFDMPGEYEVSGFSVKSIRVGSYNETYETKDSNIYSVDIGGGETVAVLSHCTKNLEKDALDLLSSARVLVVPVGGFGLSMEPEDALILARSLNPDLVIPTHFEDGVTEYGSAQLGVEKFLELAGNEVERYKSKLKYKPGIGAEGSGFKLAVIEP
jgi:L-ascorbate metabolism protein UlaG (beta-lactamase superfamily)